MSIFQKKVSEEQDKYIKRVVKRHGANYEDVRKRMDYALKKYGVDYKTFSDKQLFVLNERRWKNIARKAKEKQQRQVEELNAAGISPKTAEKLINDINDKVFYEFSIDQLIQYKLVFMDFEEACELAKKLKRRRNLVKDTKKAFENGTKPDQIEELYQLCAETMTNSRHSDLSKFTDDEKIIVDMDVSNKIFRTTSMEYQLYRFKDIPFENRWAFLANNIKNETLRSLPKGEDGDKFRALCDMVDNKIAAYERFKEYYKRDCVEINSITDFGKFEDFCKKHSRFIKKPLTSSQGDSIEVFDVTDDLKELFKRVRTHKRIIIEELVIQNEITARFNQDSINTFRIITFNDGENVDTKWGFFRTGRKGSVVDNAGAGGVFAVIDCNSGTICTDGADEKGGSYPAHPETGEKYKGFEIPKWEELRKTCIELSSQFPEAAIIGWDFAYTDKDEWVIIEANCMPEFVFQGPTGVGVKDDFMALIEKRKANIYG